MAEPRIAIVSLSIECNRFAPVSTKADFAARALLAGKVIIEDARSVAPRTLAEIPGFFAGMDASGPWQPVPLAVAQSEPGGPIEQRFFEEFVDTVVRQLTEAGDVDGVYCALHGAALATDDGDPEGTLLISIREIVGEDVPIVATFDLHGNLSGVETDMLDALIGYRTNPHIDLRERGEEAAETMRLLLGGTRTQLVRMRLPIVAPSVSLLTPADAPHRPYGEMIDLGQTRMREAPYAGRVLNVSVMGGFAYSDTPFNGLTIVVTATDQEAAYALATEIAEVGWANRQKFVPKLTPLDAAVDLARETGDPSCPARIFADVADNPGGGARARTMWILQAFHEAGIRDAIVGLVCDAAVAAAAHDEGEGACFEVEFNSDGGDEYSEPWKTSVAVRRLHEGPVVGRRGIFKGTAIDLGLAALLDLGGISVVVISKRVQCADPAFFEAFGVDIAKARVVVVKSRGHFRGGFDEYFGPSQVIEVDAPGMTSPVLSRFAWKNLPRPVVPLDSHATWAPGWAGAAR